jgi:hypothetical protein
MDTSARKYENYVMWRTALKTRASRRRGGGKIRRKIQKKK